MEKHIHIISRPHLNRKRLSSSRERPKSIITLLPANPRINSNSNCSHRSISQHPVRQRDIQIRIIRSAPRLTRDNVICGVEREGLLVGGVRREDVEFREEGLLEENLARVHDGTGGRNNSGTGDGVVNMGFDL